MNLFLLQFLSLVFSQLSSSIDSYVAQAKPAKMLLFDSWFDQHRGVIALFKIVDGEVKKGDFIASYHTGAKCVADELFISLGSSVTILCFVCYSGNVAVFNVIAVSRST